MYVVAVHDISDVEKFWNAVRGAPIPEGIRLHSTLPSTTGGKAVCLWEADSVGAVSDLVDSTAGGLSTNQFFEVGTENALGLPA